MKTFSSYNKIAYKVLLGFAAALFVRPGLVRAQVASTKNPQSASTNQVEIEQVVVTAERRAERGLNVPISMTVFSAKRLSQLAIVGEKGLQGIVPSLTMGVNGQGSRDVASATIRGQGATFEASPGVVEYFDEVPLPAPISLSQQGGPGNLFDLQDIQILKGPQGTLFGRNTTGGAILLVPNRPTNKFSGYISAGSGSYDLQDYEGAVNIPIISNKLLIRVSGKYYDRGGFTHDLAWNVYRDNEHWYTGRFEVLYRPTHRLQDFLLLYGTRSHDNGPGLINMGFNIPMLAAYHMCSTGPVPPVPAGYSCNVYSAATAQQKAWGPHTVAYSTNEFNITRTWGVINKTDYDLNDNITLRNIASYQYFYSSYAYDADGTVLQHIDENPIGANPPGNVTLPYAGTPITYSNAVPINYGTASQPGVLPRDLYDDITEELQVQGEALSDKLSYTGGAFYYLQEPAGMMGSASIDFCPALYTGSRYVCPERTQVSSVTNRSRALYAQATLDLSIFSQHLKGLSLTGGYRYTWDTVVGSAYAYGPKLGTGNVTCGASGTIVPAVLGPTDCLIAATLHSTAPSWLVALDYKVRPDMMIYAKVSHSYKSGGFNPYAVYTSTETFLPEYDTTYEAGLKSDMPVDGMPARLNADYYYTDYTNIQKAVPDTNFLTGAAGAAVRTADARIQGVELEASIQPFHFLELGANFGYIDAKYTHYSFITPSPVMDCSKSVIAPLHAVNLTCLPFQYVMPRTYSIHAIVNIPIRQNWGNLSFFVNYAHNSNQYTDAVYLPSQQPGAMLGAYGLINMSLNWNHIMGKPVGLTVYVTNAADRLYRISNSDVYASTLYWSTMYGEPRMIGFKVRYDF